MGKTIFLFLLGFLISFSNFAQQAGSLDTSFKIRQNYGAVFKIDKTWPLANGSVICYSQWGNQFGNRLTGDFFKIKPDGELDTIYQSARLGWRCFAQCLEISCRFDKDEILCLPNGEIFTSITMNKIWGPSNIYEHIFPDGNRDTSFSTRFQNKQLMIFQQDGPKGLVLGNNKIYFHDFGSMAVDSISHPHFDSITFGFYPVKSKSSQFQAFLGMDSNHVWHIFYFNLSNHQITRKKNLLGANIIGLDNLGKLYGLSQFPNGIKRQNLDGTIDSNYQVNIHDLDVELDSLGGILKQIGETKKEKIMLRFHENSSQVDTFRLRKEYFENQFSQDKKVVQRDENGRFRFSVFSPNGNPILDRFTRFGTNESIRTVLSDSAGRAIVLGDFEEFDHWKSRKLSRVLANGVVDTSFFCNQFSTEDAIHPIHFGFFPNKKDILFINQFPIGKWKRYIFKIRPDGELDSTFASDQNQVLLNSNFYPKAACFGQDGSIFFTFRKDSGVVAKERIAKISPNGLIDNGFQSSYSISTYAHWKSYKTALLLMHQEYLLTENLQPSTDNLPPPPPGCSPPLKTPNTSSFQRINMDGSIAADPSVNFNLGDFVLLEYGFSNLGLIINRGFQFPFCRIKKDGILDSLYKPRFLNASGNLTYFNDLNIKFIQEGNNLVAYALETLPRFGLIKLDATGLKDSNFVSSLSGVGDVAEIDSLSLYIGGSISKSDSGFFIGHLAKLRNKPTLPSSTKGPKSGISGISIFPNPTSDQLNFQTSDPGFQFQIFNLQGKSLFAGNPGDVLSLKALGMKPGFYFWSATSKGKFLGSGKLIKE